MEWGKDTPTEHGNAWLSLPSQSPEPFIVQVYVGLAGDWEFYWYGVGEKFTEDGKRHCLVDFAASDDPLIRWILIPNPPPLPL